MARRKPEHCFFGRRLVQGLYNGKLGRGGCATSCPAAGTVASEVSEVLMSVIQ
jgi:hypothetical protein